MNAPLFPIRSAIKRLDGLVGGRDCGEELGTSAIAWFPTAQALWSTLLGCGEEERTRNEGVVFVGLRCVKHADQAIGRAGEQPILRHGVEEDLRARQARVLGEIRQRHQAKGARRWGTCVSSSL